MTKILKVIKPFAMMDAEDTFELSENGNYISSYSNAYNSSDENDDFAASFTSSYEISPTYAKKLIDDGYLAEDKPNDEKFVNVFDEIKYMRDLYQKDLNELAEVADEMPACMRVEKETVLRNMIKVLDHLNSLKK